MKYGMLKSVVCAKGHLCERLLFGKIATPEKAIRLHFCSQFFRDNMINPTTIPHMPRLPRFVPTATSLFVLIAALALSLGQGMAVAQVSAAKPAPQAVAKSASEPLTIKLERKKVTQVDGKELLVSAAEVKPGETLEETATYANQSKKNLRVDATLPVPKFTELVVGSVRPADVKASLDGKSYAAMPLKRKVKQANGVVLEQVVPVAEYRFLRWETVDLGPEKSFVVSARFRLLENAGSATPAKPAAPAKSPN